MICLDDQPKKEKRRKPALVSDRLASEWVAPWGTVLPIHGNNYHRIVALVATPLSNSRQQVHKVK